MRGIMHPGSLIGRFLRHKGGNPLIQFALVAPVFFALVFMIIDDGLAIFTQATLDNATRDASRNILLGTYQQNGSTDATNKSNFKTAVCNEMGGLMESQSNCTSILQVYVNNASSFASLTAQTGSGGTLSNNGTFSICQTADCPSSGASGVSRYVIVQAAYDRLYIPFIGRYVSGGDLLLISTIVFQTEPYS